MPQRTAISQKRVGGGGAGCGEEEGRGGDFRRVFSSKSLNINH